MKDNVTKLEVEFKYRRTVTKREMVEHSVSDRMAWEVCWYVKSSCNDDRRCHHCPRQELVNIGTGRMEPATKMCRLLAEEAAQAVLVVCEQEAV